MADITRRIPGCDDDCENGERGERGERGESGERGERGERGKRGPRGHDGNAGHDGAIGPTGPMGATGPTGPTGFGGPVATDGVTVVGNGTPENPLSAPLLVTYVYRPGATGEFAPGGNVYTDWYALMEQIRATENQGYRYIQFDNRFAPDPATDPVFQQFAAFNVPVPPPVPLPNLRVGFWPAVIPPPLPGESWDMLDVIWTDRGGSPGLDATYVQILDGGPGRPNHIDNLKRLDPMIFGIVYNGLTPGNHPFRVSRSILAPQAGPFYGWVFEGVRLRVYNTTPLAQPIWISDVPGPAGRSFMDLQNNAALGLNPAGSPPPPAPTTPSPAPIIEIVAGATFILFGKRTTQVQNNTFLGPVGAVISLQTYFSEVWGNAEDPQLQWDQPQFLGTIAPLEYICATQRFRPSTNILTAPGPAHFGNVVRVDSTGAAPGSIVVTLPKASFYSPGPTGDYPWEGTAVTVLDISAAPVPGAIVVVATPGDSINGVPEAGGLESATTVLIVPPTTRSLRFWPDRTTAANPTGRWYTLE